MTREILEAYVVLGAHQWGDARDWWQRQVVPLLMQCANDTRADGVPRGVLLVGPGKKHLKLTVTQWDTDMVEVPVVEDSTVLVVGTVALGNA